MLVLAPDPSRRRSSQGIERLVAEFRTSGLRQSEFCRIHGLTHGTLQRKRLSNRTPVILDIPKDRVKIL
jgi:hypothetical protein